MAAALRKGFHAFDSCLYNIANVFFTTTEGIETGRQFLTFAVIGIMNTIVDFGIYYFLTRHIAFFDYHTSRRYLANSISFLIATSFSFWLNRSWTFRRTGRPAFSELLRFYVTTLGGLFVNNLILLFFSGFIGMEDLIAKIFSTVFNTVWNFIFKKLWVFVPATENRKRR